MPSPHHESFFPLMIDNLAHLVRKNKRSIRGRIVGKGELEIGKKKRKFFIFRMPVGDGSTGRFPLLVPEEMAQGDRFEICLVEEIPVLKMIFDKQKIDPAKPSARIALARVPPMDAIIRCDKSITYRKLEKDWVLVAVDDHSYLEQALKKIERQKSPT